MTGKREFGFASFEGWMLRHKSFRDEEELAAFMRDSVPRDAYVSCARYEDPEAEMDKKGWVGADLIFDIDADHIPTSCDKIHDEWACSACGFAGRGVVPERCPACGGEKLDSSTWPCETCLASAKEETLKLLNMLTQDFGFSEKEIRVFFSGHRGYHVQVESETDKELDSIARKEIVDYVSGIGLDPSLASSGKGNRKSRQRPQRLPAENSSWDRRIVSGMKDFVLNANEEGMIAIGIGKKEARTLLSSRDMLSRSWSSRGILSAAKGIGPETWGKLTEHSIAVQSAKVDTVVTTDVHRLIRLQNTLHGKTGFKKSEFPMSALNSFDPFRSAIAFETGTAAVLVSSAPEFRIHDQIYGPYHNQEIELPTAAAVLLICKGRAKVVE
jgi:DNA primase small subunit